jgi:hypothetical protein
MAADNPQRGGEPLTLSVVGDVRLPSRTWQRVSRGLFLKLVGLALGVVAVAGVLLTEQPRTAVAVPLFAALCSVGVGLDVAGRLLCLSAPLERSGRQAVVSSVAAQLVAVAAAAAALAVPWWQQPQAGGFQTALVLLALLSQFVAALLFARFLRELSEHLRQDGLASLGRTLEKMLWLPAPVAVGGSAGIVVVAVLVFVVFTVLTCWFGWILAVAAVHALGVPLVLAVLALLGVAETCYVILVFRLAVLTARAARELRESGA